MYRLQYNERLIRTDSNLKRLLNWALKNRYYDCTIHKEVKGRFNDTFETGVGVSQLDYMYRQTGKLLL